MLSEKELRVAAKELNRVCGLDPVIDPTQNSKQLAAEIKEVAETKKPEPLIKPGDKFTAPTQRIIDILTGKVDDHEEETPPEEAERLHEENVAGKKVNTVKGQKFPKEEEEDEPEETPNEEDEVVDEKPVRKSAPKKPKKEGVKTKKAIVLEMIATKTGATIEEMAQAMVDQGVDDDLKTNLVVTKLWLSKMGFDTKKAAIEKNPRFKKK